MESDLRAVFSYFLMYGKAPIEGNGMWAAIGNGWRFYKHKWLIDAKGIKVDRLSIIKALAAYAAFIN